MHVCVLLTLHSGTAYRPLINMCACVFVCVRVCVGVRVYCSSAHPTQRHCHGLLTNSIQKQILNCLAHEQELLRWKVGENNTVLWMANQYTHTHTHMHARLWGVARTKRPLFGMRVCASYQHGRMIAPQSR